ncbi:DUF4232 domain-containing protein [Streptomyces sp. NPDC048275]|uniref:DUF4232 domain-containing protein n=1 Tax=Streptomyces sp. NPDC048275 TaxID=3155629 RepID=UPI0033F9C6EB
MIAIRLTWTRSAVLACLLALAASGCGLSSELDRELNPDRKPTPSRTRAAPPPVSVPPVSAPPEPSPTVPVQVVRGCPSSGVRVDTGPVDAAMGLRAMTLILTNCGTRPYEVNGYPSVRVLDEGGAPIPGVRTVEGTGQVPMAPEDTGAEPLTLAPGDTAWAALYWRMAAADGTYLRVAPQKGRDTMNVRPEEPLDIGPENTLGTTAWAPGP